VLCLNRSLRCSGSPDHALSPERLEHLYGQGWVPYHHRHQPRQAGLRLEAGESRSEAEA